VLNFGGKNTKYQLYHTNKTRREEITAESVENGFSAAKSK